MDTKNEPKRMDQAAAAKKLDSIQARKTPVSAKLCGVPVTVVPLDGNAFRILLSMVNPGADKAAKRLDDVAANVAPWPPQGHCSAEATWDTTLHYLAMTGDLVFH